MKYGCLEVLKIKWAGTLSLNISFGHLEPMYSQILGLLKAFSLCTAKCLHLISKQWKRFKQQDPAQFTFI